MFDIFDLHYFLFNNNFILYHTTHFFHFFIFIQILYKINRLIKSNVGVHNLSYASSGLYSRTKR